jgi:hypothetical protein
MNKSVHPAEFVRQRIEQLRKFSADHEEEISTGRRLGRELIGRVFQAGIEIGADTEALNNLHEQVDGLPELEGHKWFAGSKTVFENVLVLTFGYKKTHSKRHYYNKACVKAQAAGKRTVEEFVALIEKDGLMRFVEGGGSGTSAVDPAKVLQDYAASLTVNQESEGEEGDEETDLDKPELIERAVHPDENASGLALLLVKQESENSSIVLREVTDPKLVASVVSAITAPPSIKQLDRIEKLARWDLNRVAEKMTDVWRGKVLLQDLEQFKEAVDQLERYPTLAEKYFDGKPDVWIDKDQCELEVQNRDMNRIDPARFIKNAKPLALVPFGLKTDTPVKKDVIEKLPGYRLWKENPPRRRPSGSKDEGDQAAAT